VFVPKFGRPKKSFSVQTTLFNFSASSSSHVIHKITWFANVTTFSRSVNFTSLISNCWVYNYTGLPFIGKVTPPKFAASVPIFKRNLI
jgi:hypothetical protein